MRNCNLVVTVLISACSLWSYSPRSIEAQIIPDNTLGAESSLITPNANIQGINSTLINGGVLRGSNLFHSFQSFNVDPGSGAFFANPASIQNIFSRVTGGNISNIDGVLGVLGNANLFFANPNGVIFGPNARLELNGSFLASTASSFIFDNGFEFSANNPQSPPLLTINVPIGLGFANSSSPTSPIPSISVLGDRSGIRTTSELIDTTTGLRVQPNGTLALVGGDIFMSGGTLKTAGGRIELGSVAPGSIVSLSQVAHGFELGYGNATGFRDIQLTDRTAVDASGASSGNINVQGGLIRLTAGSRIESSTLVSGDGGDLNVRGDLVELSGIFSDSENFLPSALFAQVFAEATGNGGDLAIATRQLRVTDNAQISTNTFGNGNGGNLRINASESVEVSLVGGLFASVGSGAVGNGGDLTIETAQLRIADGAQISAGTFGNGNSGNFDLIASDSVSVSAGSGLLATVGSDAVGNGGDLSIQTANLSVTNGGQISASTFGNGDSGNLDVMATESVAISDGSALLASVGAGAVGNGGDLSIQTAQLRVTDGAQINVSTAGNGNSGNLMAIASELVEVVGASSNGQNLSGLSVQVGATAVGNGGDLSIQTVQLRVDEGAAISASTFGSGDSGNLSIEASESVAVSGAGIRLSVQVEPGAVGNGGNLNIQTPQLQVSDGAQISVSTAGSGNSGNLRIEAAESVAIAGISSDGTVTSGLFAQVSPAAEGNGGNLNIQTPQLQVSDGAQINVSTSGNGNSGNLAIFADAIELTGFAAANADIFPSGLFARVESGGIGSGGDISVTTDQLQIRDLATISVSDRSGFAGAGTIRVNADTIRLEAGSIDAETRGGDRGSVILNANSIQLLDSGFIQTNAFGAATGGNINIDTGVLAGLPSANITANAEQQGGAIAINAEGIFGFTALARQEIETLLGTNDLTNFNPFADLPNSSNIIAISTSNPSPALSGVVDIDVTGTDPSSGLLPLSDQVIDPTRQIVQRCPIDRQGNEFIITGRGGIPDSPNTSRSTNPIFEDLGGDNSDSGSSDSGNSNENNLNKNNSDQSRLDSNNLDSSNLNKDGSGAISDNGDRHHKSQLEQSSPVLEARGWVVDSQGKVVLFASASSSGLNAAMNAGLNAANLEQPIVNCQKL